jgi:hypothetical protein
VDIAGRTAAIWGAVVVSRIFTILAAALLVVAFALLVLPPDGMTLVQALAGMTQDAPGQFLEQLQRAVTATLGTFAWVKVLVPLLVRPVWLVPLALGLFCAGIAVSTLPPAESPRRTGRRL